MDKRFIAKWQGSWLWVKRHQKALVFVVLGLLAALLPIVISQFFVPRTADGDAACSLLDIWSFIVSLYSLEASVIIALLVYDLESARQRGRGDSQ